MEDLKIIEQLYKGQHLDSDEIYIAQSVVHGLITNLDSRGIATGTKRQDNTTALKVKFIPCTNNLPNRIKIIQLNNKKHITINFDYSFENTYEKVFDLLSKIKSVRKYSLVIDNTQNDHYLITVSFTERFNFGDLIESIKEIEGRK